MKNEIASSAASSPPTALEVALNKTRPSDTPLTDYNLSERDRKDGPTQKSFTTDELNVNGRKPEFDRRQFIEWMQSRAVADWVPDWAAFRTETMEKFPDAPLLPESPDGLRTVPVMGVCEWEEIKQLGAIQAEVGQTVETMNPYSLTAVTQRMFKIRDAHAEAIQRGEDPGLMPSRETIARDSLQRMSVFTAKLVRITHERLVPLAKPILERFDRKVVEFLRRIEIRDREACGIMGIEFHASLEWKCAFVVAVEWKPEARLPRPAAWTTPKQILDGIVEI